MHDGDTAASAARNLPVRDFACALGLSILFPYFRAFFLSIVKTADVHSAGAFEGAFYAFAITFALCAVAALVMGPCFTKLATSRKALLASGILGSIGCLLLWLAPFGALELAQCIVGAAANVVFFTVCLFAYLAALEHMELRRATLIVVLGFGLCFASNLFYLFPTVVQAGLCVVSPFIATLCAPRPAQTAQTATCKEAASPFSTASLALCILLALFCVMGNFIRGVTNPWFDISDISLRTLYMSLVNIAFVAVTAVLLVRGASLNRVVFFNWIAYMLLFFAGVLVTFILSAAIVIMLGFLLLRSTEAADQSTAPIDPATDLTAAIAVQDSVEELVSHELASRYGLTPREAEVVRCASQGHSLEKTAELLGVSVNTVRTHNRSAYAKMGVHSRQEIIELAGAVRAELAEGR